MPILIKGMVPSFVQLSIVRFETVYRGASSDFVKSFRSTVDFIIDSMVNRDTQRIGEALDIANLSALELTAKVVNHPFRETIS
jgi:hypothetical protein